MSLRRALPGDERRLQAWLGREPYFNLFLIAGLGEGLGSNLDVWEQPDVGVIQRWGRYWAVDAGPRSDLFDAVEAARIMDSYPPAFVRTLVGRSEAVAAVYDRLQRHRGHVYEQRFAALLDRPAPLADAGTPRPATAADRDALAALYADAGDLARPRVAVEAQLPNTWVVEDRDAIVSAANTSAQTDRAAMIGGVFTPPAQRRQGYASTVVHALAAWLASQGKVACLFYHDPAAGRVYRRLGFREIGPWRDVHFTDDGPVTTSRRGAGER